MLKKEDNDNLKLNVNNTPSEGESKNGLNNYEQELNTSNNLESKIKNSKKKTNEESGDSQTKTSKVKTVNSKIKKNKKAFSTNVKKKVEKLNTDEKSTSLAKKKTSKLKTKLPFDFERQCGVLLSSGERCIRSLTCKTHLMSAKRSVYGRSAPFDILLQRYQKMNQAKLAAINALAAKKVQEEDYDSMESESDNNDIFINEEVNLIVKGLLNYKSQPLEYNKSIPVRNRMKFLSMREFYLNGLANSNFLSQNNYKKFI